MAYPNQPTDVIGWIPDNTTNITDPASLKTNGYATGSTPLAVNWNWITNRISQWVDYLKAVEDRTLRANTTLHLTSVADVPAAQTIIDEIDCIADGITLTINITKTVPGMIAGSLDLYNFGKSSGILEIASATGSDYLQSSGITLDFRSVHCNILLDSIWASGTGGSPSVVFQDCTGPIIIDSTTVDSSGGGDAINFYGCPNVYLDGIGLIDYGAGASGVLVSNNSKVFSTGLNCNGYTDDWTIDNNSTVTNKSPGSVVGSSIIQDGGAYRYYTGSAWAEIYNSF